MEAARLDARSSWQVFRHVTFPLLLPWSATAVLLRSLEMLKIVDLVTVLTNGGPGIATESLTLFVYRVGLKNTDIGYASVVAYLLLFFAIIVSTLFLLGVRRYIQRVSL
jgi:multiple sugar transport system permease protein